MENAQKVNVDGYTYLWTGKERLAVGDSVLLPENHVSAYRKGPGPFVGTVVALESDYMGPLSTIIRRVDTA